MYDVFHGRGSCTWTNHEHSDDAQLHRFTWLVPMHYVSSKGRVSQTFACNDGVKIGKKGSNGQSGSAGRWRIERRSAKVKRDLVMRRRHA